MKKGKASTSRGKQQNRIVLYKKLRPARLTKVHQFKRTIVATTTIYDTVVHQAAAYTLGGLPNFTDFTSLFDAYRITGIKEKFIFDRTDSTAGTAGLNTLMPIMTSVVDYDDAAPYASENSYLQYENIKTQRLDKPFKRFFRPRIAQSAYAGGAFSGYVEGNRKLWLDAASTTIEYYGHKYMIDGSMSGGVGANVIGRMKRYITVYLECKNLH